MSNWTTEDSLDLYRVPNWGAGFFSINRAGNVIVRPDREEESEVDLLDLVRDLKRRGLRSPMLIRFSDILEARVCEVSSAFQAAIDEYNYGGRYRGVYPIKVNQQRRVVEEIVEFGAPMGVGLEAGSKPELLVALAVLDSKDAVIICNGYKDRAYIETALLAQRLGRTPVVVVDRFRELELLIKTASELDIRPHIGFRARLTSRGAGRWIESQFDFRSRDETPLISFVTLGELLALAEKWGWGEEKRRKIFELPQSFVMADIRTRSVLERYAELSVRWERAGQRLEQNDLWIAATASAAEAVLLTTDRDFQKLAPELAVEWLDPEFLKGLPKG